MSRHRRRWRYRNRQRLWRQVWQARATYLCYERECMRQYLPLVLGLCAKLRRCEHAFLLALGRNPPAPRVPRYALSDAQRAALR